MNIIGTIVVSITTGMAGNALYDRLKTLLGESWDRLISLKGNNAQLIKEVNRILEHKRDEIAFMKTLTALVEQQGSVINITTGDHSNIVNNQQSHGESNINCYQNHITQQVSYYRGQNGKMEKTLIDNNSTIHDEVISIYPPSLCPGIWNKVF